MHPRRPVQIGLSFLLAAACSAGACSDERTPATDADTLHLLARRPDAVLEQPGVVALQGDVPGTATWGASEGPGWSQTVLALADGTDYRETNQARATLFLFATRPVERELELFLWCARPAGDAPAPLQVRLNGIELLRAASQQEPLVPGREPALVRVHAPAPAWKAGKNTLELGAPAAAHPGKRAWDVLALAGGSYGPTARVTLDPAAEAARFVDGTGASYAVALASNATLAIEGTASGAGTLTVHTAALDPRTGALARDADALATFTPNGAGAVTGEHALMPAASSLRVIELEWSSSSGAALALTRLDVREHAPRPRPPVVFVSIDTFAARHLPFHGYDRATAPELARFAQDAVLFERCLANAPWTLPSYLSVMTGLYPRSHTVQLDFVDGAELSPYDQWQLADNRWTLAEALRARGYRTGAFVDTTWLSPQFGVAQGFDHYDGMPALREIADVHGGVELIVGTLVPPWLASLGPGRPPFLFVHALDAHGPYLPDEPFRDSFHAALGSERTLVPAGSDNQTYRWMPWWMSRTLQPDEQVPEAPAVPLEEVVARYDEALLKVDAYLGKLFELLRARGLYDDAVIVVTGDHGESFGPGDYGHGLMREDVLHVPLLVKLPGNARGGTRVGRPVALVDVYPTLLELAGAPADAERLHGTSLLARIDDPPRDERVLFSEGGHVEQYALTLGRWRLVEERPGSESSESSVLSHPRVPDEWLRAHFPEILARPLTKALLKELQAREDYARCVTELRELVKGPYYSLYDLETDPRQQRDLAAERPDLLASLKTVLAAEKERSQLARADADPSFVRPVLSPQDLEEMQKLGYGAGDEDGD